MKKLMVYMLAGYLMISCSSTSSTSRTSDSSSDKIQEMVQSKIGEDFSCEDNSDDTFSICTSDVKGAGGITGKHFVVVDLVNDKIIFEERLESGYVKWFDNQYVEFFQTPGIMPAGKTRDDFAMLFDTKSGKKMGKTEVVEAEDF
jgi:hypothetical protein